MAGRLADAARATLRGYGEAYLATCGWQKPSSLGQKRGISARLMADFTDRTTGAWLEQSGTAPTTPTKDHRAAAESEP